MSWSVRAVPLPDGDRPADLWVDAAGCLVTEPVADAERLPGRFVVPGLGTDLAGTIAREVALLAEHGLEPAAALAAATTTGYRFLGEPFDQPGQPVTLVTYQDDPREDLTVLSSPSAILIDGVRVR